MKAGHEVKSSDVDRFVQAGVLKKETFDVAELAELVEFNSNRPALSLQDCSVLKLAMQRKATLLTGDGALRKHATAENVSVHGVLWIFDRMVSRRIMKPQDAAKHLRQLMKKNPRLPLDECKKRLQRWSGE